MSTTPRKRLTGEERRAAILDAALAVFAERGYHASSIDDIAREGGISKADALAILDGAIDAALDPEWKLR